MSSQAERLRGAWRDPVWRAKNLEALKKGSARRWSRPEEREKVSRALKGRKLPAHVGRKGGATRHKIWASRTEPTISMSKEEIAWLAGVLEGEGCFGWYKDGPKVSLRMNDRDVVERVHKLIQATCSICKIERANELATVPTYDISTSGHRSIAIMKTVLPWMGDRRSKRINTILAKWSEMLVAASGY